MALPGGTVLTATDLRPRRLPLDALPDQTVDDPAALIGRTLVAPLPAGSVLTTLSTLSPRTLTDPGEVIAPVRVADPTVAALLRVGDRIDVVAGDSGGDGAKVLAAGLRIVALPSDPESGGLGVGGGSGSGSGQLVLVAATPTQATTLVDAGGALGVILH